MEHITMPFNHTTPHMSTPHNNLEFPGYYALIPFVLVTLIGCIAAVVVYIRRRAKLDNLRHRLIPLYSYDPAEDQDDWGDADRENEEEELAEPLYKEAQLTLTSGYGT